jgi:hypothetical protein
MNLAERIQSPTPTFFKKIRNIGIILTALSGTLLGAPIALPLVVIKIAGYMAVASMVATAVSQTAVGEDPTTINVPEGNGS